MKVKVKWTKLLEREGVDITTISGVAQVFIKNIREFTGSSQELFFSYFKNKTFAHYTGVDPLAVGRYYYLRHFNKPGKVKKLYQKGLRLLNDIKNSTAMQKAALKKNPSREALLSAYKIFRKQFEKVCDMYSITPWLAIESWSKNFESILTAILKKRKLVDRTEEISASFYRLWRKTALIEAREKLKMGRSEAEILQKYQFLRSWSVVWHRPLVKGSFYQVAPSQRRVSGLTIAEALNLLKPSKQEKVILAMAPYIFFYKDWRDDVRRKHAFEWTFLMEAIARHFELEPYEIGYLFLEEIEAALKIDMVNKQSINLRKHNPCLIVAQRTTLNIQVIDKKIPKRFELIRKQTERLSGETIVNGIIAQPGFQQGRVIIMNNFHDLKRIKNGDILIANTTHPNYLPAMQKAAAFVTNEGGIASHAAIVARELKKPCIVGTGNATKIFKDGDLVEVDANKGIVRKIK